MQFFRHPYSLTLYAKCVVLNQMDHKSPNKLTLVRQILIRLQLIKKSFSISSPNDLMINPLRLRPKGLFCYFVLHGSKLSLYALLAVKGLRMRSYSEKRARKPFVIKLGLSESLVFKRNYIRIATYEHENFQDTQTDIFICNATANVRTTKSAH